MAFSSGLFLFYFLPLFLLGYFALAYKWKNLFALLASLLFYLWGEPDFFPWVLASILSDYLIGRQMVRHPQGSRRLQWLWLGLSLNIALLLYFKYANFFVENISGLLGMKPGAWSSVLLPLGISFFTFQKISYLVDVYQEKALPARKLGDYGLYVLFFPQLVAGPIVRYKELAFQIEERRQALRDWPSRLGGLTRFALGMAKKVLIADVLGRAVDLHFGREDLSSPMAWIILLAYTLQIYFDFSGYSDMAIGLGRVMGFTFPENFRFPYISRDFTEFWRRWHISLSRWMRDYLYIPLGGNRQGKWATYRNLWLVFLISGFWHGAAWNFVAWGAFHGLFLSLDRLGITRRIKSIPLTFVLVMLSWVLFRANGMDQALGYYSRLFSFSPGEVIFEAESWLSLVLGIVFAFLPVIQPLQNYLPRIWTAESSVSLRVAHALLSILLLTLSAAEILVSDYVPFIYFRF